MIEVFGYEIVFQHSERLLAIPLAIIVITALSAWNFRAGVKAFAKNPGLRLHFEEARPKWRSYLTRAFGFSVLLTLLIGAWAEPERRSHFGEPVYGGVRIAFLLDVSLSMKYAHDVAPYPDRLIAAKSVLADFAAMTVRDPELRGEYWRAIIPFAASAMTYMPLTSGYDEFISAIDAIDETTINSPGTNFLLPILEYEQMLKDHPRKTDSTVDILVFISDGGKDEGVYQDFPYIRAAFQRMQNTVPFTVGIGSVEVTKLPDGTEIRKSQKVPLVIINREGKVEGYLYEDPKDPKSERQYSELDERTLASIAGSPDRYIHYTGKEVFLQKLKHIIIENRKLVNTIPHTRTAPVAQWFLVPAILIACIMLGYFRRLFSLLFSLVMFFSSKVSKAFGSSRHNI